ncbi:MAG: hypothetical protein AAGD06_30120, partial [Acidobacteriota bacterium]
SNFRPGDPGERIPLDRDTTQRIAGTTIPGASSGHEYFKGVDVLGSTLFVAYNAGIQAWRINGTNAEVPLRLSIRDGWQGHFLDFPPSSEQLNFVEDIQVLDPGAGNTIVAVTGKEPVGPSIWEWNGTNFIAKYQDEGTTIRQIRLVDTGTKVYAIGVSDNTNDSVVMYDASAAAGLINPCLDDRGTTGCGAAIRLGKLPGTGLRRYIDTIVVGNKIYAAVSSGLSFLPMEIWEISIPAIPSNAQMRFQGLNGARGMQFIQKGGNTYLALVESTAGNANDRIKIFDVDDCLDLNGCTTLGSPLVNRPIRPFPNTSEQFLTYSESGNTPFLYYGAASLLADGSQVEQLLDITNLGTTNVITEVTDGGGTYVDGCNGTTVDYWGDYYQRNDFGLRDFYPRTGKFSGNYFYRAAQTVLDVHVRGAGGGGADPVVTTEAGGTPPYYFGDAINFTATSQNCTGAENWEWFADDTNATGLGIGGASRAITWNLCAGSDCPDKQVEVWALKDACRSDPDLVENRETVNIQDPRPRIRSIDNSPSGTTHPVCTVLNFNADIDGRPGFNYAWEARDQGGVLLASGNTASFVWDTSGISVNPPDEIFADDFESGLLTGWSSTFPPLALNRGLPEPLTSIRDLVEARGAGIPVDISLQASNADGTDTDTIQLTIEPLGTLDFSTPAFTVVDLGDANYRITANTESATEWRWTIEDPENGSTTSCGSTGYTRCSVVDFGEDDNEIEYQWTSPNVSGTYRVTVEAQNCNVTAISREESINVTGVTSPEPPEMVSFTIDIGASPDCTQGALGGFTCEVDRPIRFVVTATGNPTSFEFDWDNTGDFSSTFPAGSQINHTFTVLGFKLPKVRAKKGDQISAPLTFSGLNIVPL